MAKFFNRKIQTQYGVFDSQSEYKRYLHLLDLEKRGEITNLKRQVTFPLIPKQTIDVEVKLKTKTKTKTIVAEREVTYTCDFAYTDKNGQYIVEDVKSKYTRKEHDYIIKRKLMLFINGIRLHEVIMRLPINVGRLPTLIKY